MGRALSYVILLLLACRPVLNQFQEISFGKLGSYELSLLSLWSLIVLGLLVVRSFWGVVLDYRVKVSGVIFILYLTMISLPRLSEYGNFVSSYLYIIMIVMMMMIAHKLFDDLGEDTIISILSLSSIALITMHITAFWWDANYIGMSGLGNYLGAFSSKHIAAYSFIVLIPFVYLKYVKSDSYFWLLILILNVAFLISAFQRTEILSFIIGVSVILIILKKKRNVFYLIPFVMVILLLIPESYFETFVQEKILAEVDKLGSGDIERAGAGRVGLILEGLRIYFYELSLVEKLIGAGSGYANLTHLRVVGHLTYAHLQFIQFIIDLGIFGLILCTIFVLQVFVVKLRMYRFNSSRLNMIAITYLIVFACEFIYTMPFQNGGTFLITALLAFSPAKKIIGLNKNANRENFMNVLNNNRGV